MKNGVFNVGSFDYLLCMNLHKIFLSILYNCMYIKHKSAEYSYLFMLVHKKNMTVEFSSIIRADINLLKEDSFWFTTNLFQGFIPRVIIVIEPQDYLLNVTSKSRSYAVQCDTMFIEIISFREKYERPKTLRTRDQKLTTPVRGLNYFYYWA